MSQYIGYDVVSVTRSIFNRWPGLDFIKVTKITDMGVIRPIFQIYPNLGTVLIGKPISGDVSNTINIFVDGSGTVLKIE